MSLDSNAIYQEIIGVRNMSDTPDAKMVIGRAMNNAILKLNADAGTSVDEITFSQTTGEFSDVGLAAKWGMVFRRITEYYLEQSPFWTRDKTINEADLRRTMGEARGLTGYSWTGPNLNYS